MTTSFFPPNRQNVLGLLGLSEGRSVLSAAHTSPHWTVGNICDLNETLCRERAAEFGLTRWTLRYEDLLADPAIDTIAIFTPDALHATHIRAALRAGKDVICTKPVLKGMGEAAALWREACACGRRILSGNTSRFFGPVLRQRADFEAGRLGALNTVEAHYHGDKRVALGDPTSWKKNWLYTGIIHPADLALWYLPDLEEVFGYATTSAATVNAEMPDTYHFVLKARSGAIARVSGCYSSPEMPRAAEAMTTCILRGERGASVAENPTFNYHTHFDGEAAATHNSDADYAHYFRFGDYRYHAGEVQNYLDHFALARAAGATPRPDLREALLSIALVETMAESLHTGQPARVSMTLSRHDLAELILP